MGAQPAIFETDDTRATNLDEYRFRRSLLLSHLRQVRLTLRSGRYSLDCHRIIRLAQRDLAVLRSRLLA